MMITHGSRKYRSPEYILYRYDVQVPQDLEISTLSFTSQTYLRTFNDCFWFCYSQSVMTELLPVHLSGTSEAVSRRYFTRRTVAYIHKTSLAVISLVKGVTDVVSPVYPRPLTCHFAILGRTWGSQCIHCFFPGFDRASQQRPSYF